MKLTQVFWLADYFYYLWRSNSRHGTHSPFVYQFADKILYQKAEPNDIDLLELWRSEIMDYSWKNRKNPKNISPSNQFPQKKYLTFLYRILKADIANGLFLEIGQSAFSVPRICESAHCALQYVHVSDCHPIQLPSYSESYETEITTLYPQLPIQDLQSIIEKDQEIGIIFINANIDKTDPKLEVGILDSLIHRLENNGMLILNGIDNNWNQRDLWDQLIKHPRVTAHIDLFRMGILFVRPEQQKEKFILRY